MFQLVGQAIGEELLEVGLHIIHHTMITNHQVIVIDGLQGV